MKKLVKNERVSDEVQSPIINESPNQQDSNPDLKRLIEDSKNALASQPTKRKRRTKAEMMQAQGSSGQTAQANPSSAPIQYTEQDLTMMIEPILKVADSVAANHFQCPEMKSSDEDIVELAKQLNKPLNVINAHATSKMDPLTGAYVTLGFTVSMVVLGKVMIYQEMKKSNVSKPEAQ